MAGARPWDLFIEDWDFPVLTIPSPVMEVLWGDRVIDRLRADAGLTYELDEYEADDLPPDCLEAFAVSCRRHAEQYGPSVPARDSLLAVADVADRAREQGVPLGVRL